MRTRCLILSLLGVALLTASAAAQFKKGGPAGGPELAEGKPERWKVGIAITAAGGPCKGISGYVPVPLEWPEQQVREIEEDVSSTAKISYRTVDGTARLMMVKIPTLATGQTATAVVTFEVTRRPQLPPESTDEYVLADPNKLPRDVRRYLSVSPYIEVKHPKIREALKEIEGKKETADDEEAAGDKEVQGDEKAKGDKEATDDKEMEGVADEATAWEQVEAIYNWVRENVKYQQSAAIKSAVTTLRDKSADCEGMTALFIALCRAKGVPARTVWVEGHCYPEFYLEDGDHKGHWFPCQISGSESFGGIPETRPIWQKGDNFRVPNSRQRVHYLAEQITGLRMSGTPQKRSICQRVNE